MKTINKIVKEKTRTLDIALLGVTILGYGVAMAFAAGLALIGKESDKAQIAESADNEGSAEEA